jgi:hypothetical protein
MKKFEYLILVAEAESSLQSGVVWQASTGKALGPNLPSILNDLGQDGWEVVAAADLVFGPRADIILKRELK